MKIYFATDHAGFELKEELVSFVRDELGLEVEDLGVKSLDPKDDYPDFIVSAARAISEAPETARAIVLGGSGQGEAMVANRFPNVRATVWYGGTDEILRLSRQHNDANILSIGARFVDLETAREGVRKWLSTKFSGEERHIRRIKKIEEALHTE
ncbi:MAG: RpiB/LacA/LacB family sugar-phosphate isomerase [Candidatus Pacebacteria bacterium]|nr:RpiB/LacA/LacB family sugar-phosphate isomerase [Candidatus Paceibacterota bacterium]